MLKRAALLVVAYIAFAVPAGAAPATPPQPTPALQLDLEGVEAFWGVAATLKTGEQPTDEQWEHLFGTPGYGALTRSEFEPEFFRDAFALALDPARAAEREALEPGRLARVVNHVRRVSEREEELRAWSEELRGEVLAGAVTQTLDLVPDAWKGERSVIAFVVFDFDARGYDPIVVDLLASKELDLGPFLAHESHHWLRNRHLTFDRALAGPEDEAALWVLDQLQAEGIADRIDKARYLRGEAEPPAQRADYMASYRAHVEAGPDTIRQLDALLRQVANGDDPPEGWTDSLRQAIPQSGHPTGYFMAERIVAHHGEPALVASAGDPFAFVGLYQGAARSDPDAPVFSAEAIAVIRALEDRVAWVSEFDRRVDDDDKVFLYSTLDAIDPPTRIQELFGFAGRQHGLGGGFHGMLPPPLDGIDALPVPVDEASAAHAAVLLTRRRAANLEALHQVLPTFPVEFRGDPIVPVEASAPAGWSLDLDRSAIEGFLEARSDGEITLDEARTLAALPANREMLRHRKQLGYMPGPLPTADDLAALIAAAGSPDPLDRLWAWLHPWNDFGYADVATRAAGYAGFVEELRRAGDDMTAAVLARLAAHAPAGVRYEGAFAITIGCLIRGWVTQAMPGLNVDQVKDDWAFLQRVMTHETYHKIQPRICPAPSGETRVDFEDLATAELEDPRDEKLYAVLAYTVLEGTANYVAGPDGKVDSAQHAAAGTELLAEFYRRVMVDGDLGAADELVAQGLRNNGPLYALGYQLSARIAEAEGARAVGEWLAKGPVPFVVHAEELAGEAGESLLPVEMRDAVDRLNALDTFDID